jgi:lysophospholipase L1-like esterase
MKKIIIVLFLAGVCLMLGNLSAAQDVWVTTWGCGEQLTEPNNMPPPPGLADNTLRQIVHSSIGGKRVRVQFSNAWGRDPVEITTAYIAVSAGNGEIKPETNKILLFGGTASVTLAPKDEIFSDPVDFTVAPVSDVAVTIVFGRVSKTLTGHPGSRTTSYIQPGFAVTEAKFSEPVTTDHWYILSAIDVAADAQTRVVVTLGDSIADGRGSTTNQNNRWPDDLARRLQKNAATKKVAVVNMGIGGNAVFNGGLGPSAVARFDHDVLGTRGVKWVIVLEGVNDIGGSSDKTAPIVADQLIASFTEFADKAHAAGLKIYGIPILPLNGSQYAGAAHEAARQKVNDWMKNGGKFDAYLDLAAVVADPADPTKLAAAYDSGDHLHLSPAGYQKMADAIDLKLFR